MGWRDNLRPASFRGVPFLVDSADHDYGRRLALHEYPQRDKPFVEDLGRKAREFSIEGYVLGADYMAQRDRLLQACEAEGPGDLVHPFLGSLRVACRPCKVREVFREGRMARFTFNFVEAGENTYPARTPDTRLGVSEKADAALESSRGAFEERFKTPSKPEFVRESAARTAEALAKQVRERFGQLPVRPELRPPFLDYLKAFESQAASYVTDPSELGRRLKGLVSGMLGAALEPGRLFAGFPEKMLSEVEGLSALFQRAGRSITSEQLAAASSSGPASAPAQVLSAMTGLASFGEELPAVPLTTATRKTEAANQAAMVSLVRRAAAVEAARSTALATFDSQQEAAAAKERVAELLDAEIIASGDAGEDGVYAALTDLRTASIKDMNARGAGLAPIVRYEPRATIPALALAHRLYGDAGRGDEIAARNRVRHPGFVPGGVPLEVLANA